MSYGTWKFVHILLLVYWLGADLGVFILARAVRRSDLTFDQRALLLRYGMIIDILPRICMALTLPVGLHLIASMNLLPIPGSVLIAGWIIAAAWLLLLYLMYQAEGTPRQPKLATANLLWQAVLGTMITVTGLMSLLGQGAIAVRWLAAKILLYGLIFGCSIMIDVAFRPLGPAFGKLATGGSTPEVEAEITNTINHTVWWVLGIYALIIAIAFLGAAKPF